MSNARSSGRRLNARCWGTRTESIDPLRGSAFKDFYDYEDKYLLDKTQFRIPPDLPDERVQEIRRLAVACFEAIGCEGMSRVDFLIERSSGQIFINEINTIPGFTSISMYPKMWAHDGLAYPKLLDRLIELALERHARKRKLKFTR